jgi:hypothetical protein
MDGTPRALLPITERVIVWVAEQKARISAWEAAFARAQCDTTEARAALQGRVDMIRSIELCALAARDIAMFHDLYGAHTGRIVRDPDDSGYYLPEEDKAVIRDHFYPPQPMSFDGQTCAKCGDQATTWMMGTADESPTYLCGRWPDCKEPHAPAPEVQEQRGAPGGLPSAQGCICGSRGGPCPCPVR